MNLLLQVAAAAVVLNLGCTPGLFIVGLFGILILWMYANFWITGTLFIVGGKFQFSLISCALMLFHCYQTATLDQFAGLSFMLLVNESIFVLDLYYFTWC